MAQLTLRNSRLYLSWDSTRRIHEKFFTLLLRFLLLTIYLTHITPSHGDKELENTKKRRHEVTHNTNFYNVHTSSDNIFYWFIYTLGLKSSQIISALSLKYENI